MQRKSLRTLVAGVLLAALLAAAGCSQAPSDAEKRLTALEAEVKALRDEARTREKTMREEMAMVRTNLASIRTLLELDRDRTATPDKPGDTPNPDAAVPDASGPSDDLDRELDAKAKGFVKENLDRLLVITRKLLDKMERELDKQEETETPKPKGDEI